jgi:DNA-binding transcriptional regulator YhcF (GntR family)
MRFITINTESITPIYEQLIAGITRAIEQGVLRRDDRLPSINSICREFGISPGTVLKAYDDLCSKGILGSKRGKGYFVLNTRLSKQLNIFALFDRISAYKEVLYDSFIQHIGPSASVQVFFHHYEDDRFRTMIQDNLGKYNFYVIMPHFNHDVSDILVRIPEDKLLIIDKSVPGLKGKYAAICQHFREDIYKGLLRGLDLIRRYHRILFVRSTSKFQFIPDGLIKGFEKFLKDSGSAGEVVAQFNPQDIRPGDLYIVFPDSDLISLIKEAKNRQMVIGKDLGIIAYDDSPLKEVLEGGITVISTDFVNMGKIAAELILTGRKEKLHNPSGMIIRKSL